MSSVYQELILLHIQGVRADGNSALVDEIGKILSVRSKALGLR